MYSEFLYSPTHPLCPLSTSRSLVPYFLALSNSFLEKTHSFSAFTAGHINPKVVLICSILMLRIGLFMALKALRLKTSECSSSFTLLFWAYDLKTMSSYTKIV
jgi:hypothetical protein